MEFPLAGILFKNEMPKKLEFNKAYIINIEDDVDEEGNESEADNGPYGKIF